MFLDEVGLLPGRSPRPAPVLAPRRRAVDLRPPEQLRLARPHVPPRPGRQARGLQGAPEREGESGEKSQSVQIIHQIVGGTAAHLHGLGAPEYWLMALRLTLASSSDWPPERKTTPGMAGGTVRASAVTVARPTSAGEAFTGQAWQGGVGDIVRIVIIRALNEGSRRFHNHREGP